MIKIFVIMAILFIGHSPAFAEMGIPLKLKLKSPAGINPTESGLSVKVQVLSNGTNCILREEDFSGQSITNGSLSLSLGSGVRGVNDPNLLLTQVYDNSKSKTGLSCVDSNGAVISTGQVYTPALNDQRVLRVSTIVSGETLTMNFNVKATPYAIQSESVGGKLAADIIVNDLTTQLNQTNLADLLFDVTRFNNLKNFAISGSVSNAASAVQASNFTGALTGDVSGTQGATFVDRIKGQPVSAAVPTAGQVLAFDGTQWAPSVPSSAPVSSVAGRTGAIVLSSSDISGLGSGAALNVGTTAGTLAAGNDARILSASADLAAATSANTVSTIVKRDASGNISIGNLSSSSVSSNNLYLFDGANSIRLKAPAGLASNLIFNLPANVGTSGQILRTDGSGNLSWVTPAAGSVTAVTASAPLVSSGGSAPNLTISVGTTASTVAAGNDSRIIGALQTSAFNGYVSSAACTSSQSMYWNSVSSQFLCQNISFPTDLVTSVAGRAGAIVLSNTDISGLGTAATLNVGSAAGTVAAGDDARILSAQNDLSAATYANTASTIVKRDASGNFSAQTVNLAGDINVTGAMNGLSRNVAFQNSPTTAGTTTAYTLSFGAAMNAKITSNALGESVRFRANAVNTGPATLQVGSAPAANLFSQFTNSAIAAGDLQVGFYTATFDGTNWVVSIPPRIIKSGAVNWNATTLLTLTASGVNVGDYATCSFTTTGVAQTTTRFWTQSVMVRAGAIEVVGIRNGTPPNVTGVTCLVQK